MVWRHPLGDETELVYHEKDRLYTLRLGRSKDRKMLFQIGSSTDTWEVRYLPSASTQAKFKIVLPREKGHKYSVEHRDGLFYIRTNRQAKNFHLVTAPVADPSPAHWTELVANVCCYGTAAPDGYDGCLTSPACMPWVCGLESVREAFDAKVRASG